MAADAASARAALRAVLGDGPSDDELISLFRRHGANVAAAADAYFIGLERSTGAGTSAAPQPPAAAPGPDALWPRALGVCVIDGISLVRQGDVNAVVAGEALEIVTSAGALACASGGGGGGRPGKQRKVVDETVRFRRPGNDPRDRAHPLAEGPTLGRMPAPIARALLPLIASGHLLVRASVARSPPPLQLLSTIPVRLELSVSRGFFGGDLAARRAEKTERKAAGGRKGGKAPAGRGAGAKGAGAGDLTAEGRALLSLIEVLGLVADEQVRLLLFPFVSCVLYCTLFRILLLRRMHAILELQSGQ